MTIEDVLTEAGEWAHAGHVKQTAREWAAYRFSAEDVESWLTARCYEPSVAFRLAQRGVTPEQAARTITIGEALSNGDITIEYALELCR